LCFDFYILYLLGKKLLKFLVASIAASDLSHRNLSALISVAVAKTWFFGQLCHNTVPVIVFFSAMKSLYVNKT